jgi:hypothetical protein
LEAALSSAGTPGKTPVLRWCRQKDFVTNDTLVGLKGAVEFDELGPQKLVDEALGRPDHDGNAPLPIKPIKPIEPRPA